jgi:hypothetical protein
MVFAWSMQFIVIEWQVYSITKDPLSLGIMGLMELYAALFCFAVIRKKRKLISQMHFGFFSNQLWSIFIDMAGGRGITRYRRFY